ncbi:hypothetical protein H4R33_006838, partial [Dimargaris cristalligena]
RPQPADSGKEIGGQARHEATDTSSQTKPTGTLGPLSSEIFYSILKHLPANDRFHISKVNNRFNNLVNQDRTTQEIFQ